MEESQRQNITEKVRKERISYCWRVWESSLEGWPERFKVERRRALLLGEMVCVNLGRRKYHTSVQGQKNTHVGMEEISQADLS